MMDPAPSPRLLSGAAIPLGFIIALVLVPFILVGDRIEDWVNLGLLQPKQTIAWVVMGSLALDPILPIPSSLVSLAAGASLGLAAGFLTVFTGMSVGSLISFELGRRLRHRSQKTGANFLDNPEPADRTVRRALFFIIVFRPIPVLAETSAVFMGYRDIPFRKFAVASALANAIVAMTFASCGAWAAAERSIWVVLPILFVLALPWLLASRARPNPVLGLAEENTIQFAGDADGDRHS